MFLHDAKEIVVAAQRSERADSDLLGWLGRRVGASLARQIGRLNVLSVLNAGDNCPTLPNTDQANQDKDDKGDVCDDDADGDCLFGADDKCPLQKGCDPPPELCKACTIPEVSKTIEDILKGLGGRNQIPRNCFFDGCSGGFGETLASLPRPLLDRIGVTKLGAKRVRISPALLSTKPVKPSSDVSLAQLKLAVANGTGVLQSCALEKQKAKAVCHDGCPP